MTMTENQPSVVDADDFTVRRTVTIAAPASKVWAAVTEPEHIVKWFGQGAQLDGLSVGSRGSLRFDGYGEFPMRIEAIDPERMIAYRWGNDNASPVDPLDDAHSTVFRFTLEPVDGGTRLTVVETGFGTLSDPAASMESNRGGWDWELDELVAYLEGSA
ncbi:SRPBCC family protein [Galbitalea soli]|uniref:Activator of Hsp90 ATPase homologue 1/2-like C-terminal domain-containing protein n=1 Tax=Galbitalea soli TaxID=1268042 RepID=A0A7C9PMJ7_9MICO|nr:SRPBCC family protein [Galbitalea soli]NEM90867.1 hypothetical protein [Galbitalea soli]NYJ31587.1 uncharacterized protein YndB with AHSA1/START domain [Galbitalea soli]